MNDYPAFRAKFNRHYVELFDTSCRCIDCTACNQEVMFCECYPDSDLSYPSPEKVPERWLDLYDSAILLAREKNDKYKAQQKMARELRRQLKAHNIEPKC